MIIPDVILSPFAQNGDRSIIPQQDSSGFINFNDGYTAFYEISLTANNPQAKAVERRGMNELFYQLSQNAMAWQQMTTAPWIAGTSGGYMTNAVVARLNASGKALIYRSLVDSNTSDPLTNNSQWQEQPLWSAMRNSIAMPAGGQGSQDNSNELISATSGINAQNLKTGTWEFTTDAAANGAANMPNLFGAQIKRGMFEAKSWVSGSVTVTVQRYSSIDGRMFTRGFDGSNWTPWLVSVVPNDVQTGVGVFVQVSGTDPNFTANFSPSATSAYPLGAEIHLLFPTKNAGAANLSVNGSTSIPIVNEAGNALVGGELQSFVTLAMATGRWIIKKTNGIGSQLSDAVADQNLPRLGQVKQLIAAIGNPYWENIQNKPDVAILNTDVKFSSVTLSSATPALYFTTAAGTALGRIVPSGGNNLSIFAGTGGNTLLSTHSDVASTFYVPINASIGLIVPVGRNISFQSAAGETYFNTAHNDTYWYLSSTVSGTQSFIIQAIRATKQVNFAVRPVWQGYTPWDSNNFNPSLYRLITNTTFDQKIIANTGINVTSNQALAFTSADGSALKFYFSTNEAGTGDLYLTKRDDSANPNTIMVAHRDTGVISFTYRPNWQGYTPWDSANFNPNAYRLITNTTYSTQVRALQGVAIPSLISLNFMTADMSAALYQTGHDASFFYLKTVDDNAKTANVFSLNRSTGQLGLTVRPGWAGLIPWDSGNLNPALYRLITNTTFNTLVVANGNVSLPSGSQIQWASSSGSPVRYFTQHDDTSFVLYSAGDSTNIPAIAVTRNTGVVTLSQRPSWLNVTPWDSGNYNPQTYLQTNLPAALVAQAYNEIGSYGLFIGFGTSSAANYISPGDTRAGTQLRYSNCAASSPNLFANPPGTWRCMGGLINADGSDPDSVTIWQRIA